MKKIQYNPILIKLAKERGEWNHRKKNKSGTFQFEEKRKYESFSSYFMQECNILPNNTKQRNLQLIAPKIFSFIENPEETIGFFYQLVEYGFGIKTRSLCIDQSACEHIDLCAETVASVILKELQDKYKMHLSGTYPKEESVKRMVLVSGIPKCLGVSNYMDKNYTRFNLIEGHKTKAKADVSSTKEIRGTQLTEYINRCLNACGWSFSRTGKGRLGKLTGEVIDNAENHSGLYHWWVQAYQHSLESGKRGECHLVMFNFGKSIYESLAGLKHDSRLREKIQFLVDAHSSKGFFSNQWNTEALWTLYSLQEGASRLVDDGEANKDRGQGLPDLVEYFQILGQSSSQDEHPTMCLISGNVFIKFDNTYKIAKVTKDGKIRRQIAFNKENDLSQPPDNSKVRMMKRKFPGTVFSLRFYIDDSNLEKIKNGNKS